MGGNIHIILKYSLYSTAMRKSRVGGIADTNMLVSKNPGGPNMKPRRPIAKPYGPNARANTRQWNIFRVGYARVWFALAMYISCFLVANANVVSGRI